MLFLWIQIKKKADRAMRQIKKLYLMVINRIIWVLIAFFVVMTLALIMCFVFESGIKSSAEIFNLIDKLFGCPQMTSFLFESYKKGYDFLMSFDIGDKLDDFNLILSMEMICSAVIVFLYSRFSENTYGLPVEYLIRQQIGHLVLGILRITALVLPLFFLFCFLKSYIYTVLFCLLDIYIIISIFVLLCLEIMREESTIVLIERIMKREWRKLNKKRRCIIPVFFHGNYLKKRFFLKAKLCTSTEVYYLLSWDGINLLFNDENLESKTKVIQEIFLLLSRFGTNYQDVDFINLFNITYGMLEAKNLKETVKLGILRMFILKLNEHSQNNEKIYEEKYYAIIMAILFSQKLETLEYLWNDFFYGLNQRSKELNLSLYVFSYKFIEIMIMKGNVSKSSLKLALRDKDNLDYIKSAYKTRKRDQLVSFNVRLSFLLSVIGIMDQEIVMRCLTEFDQDMLRTDTCYKTGFWNITR